MKTDKNSHKNYKKVFILDTICDKIVMSSSSKKLGNSTYEKDSNILLVLKL